MSFYFDSQILTDWNMYSGRGGGVGLHYSCTSCQHCYLLFVKVALQLLPCDWLRVGGLPVNFVLNVHFLVVVFALLFSTNTNTYI